MKRGFSLIRRLPDLNVRQKIVKKSVRRFIDEFGESQFNHATRLFPGLEDGTITLYCSPRNSKQKAEQYLDIYKSRFDHLTGMPRTSHVEGLLTDVGALCHALSCELAEVCELWIFNEKPYFDYSVFVGKRSRSVFGCIRGVDDTKIDSSLRNEIWGDTESD